MESVHELQQRLRSNLDPVSAFYLVDSPVGVDRMFDKLAGLTAFGASAEDLAALRASTSEWLRTRARTASSPWQMLFGLRIEGEARWGMAEFADVPGRGVEVQLILPGRVATALGLQEDGFFCAFMPPSFYD